MWDKFGEFDSAEELNELAGNLRREGDRESLLVLARENGIDTDIAEVFLEGDLLYLCDPMTAALGKIEIEAASLKPVEIMADWVEYLRTRCFEDEGVARAVRRKGKSLKGAVGALLIWSFGHQTPVDKEVLKAAKVNAGRCTLGIPGMARAKQLMSDYYLGGSAK